MKPTVNPIPQNNPFSNCLIVEAIVFPHEADMVTVTVGFGVGVGVGVGVATVTDTFSVNVNWLLLEFTIPGPVITII